MVFMTRRILHVIHPCKKIIPTKKSIQITDGDPIWNSRLTTGPVIPAGNAWTQRQGG
uniref:Uncharacterized protein n=1 Tax=Candidatus Kentrum sp. SD TaxID=2126332 RepID=A0A450YT05_9GAMM|nr:MAG: hypothetical protein BECKSD772E_GA0070983_10424 [Candidatus Kentron sp. SD]